MSSQRRIESSRLNGALSRGPVTPEGQQACVASRLRHGLLTKTIVLEGESHERFEALLAGYLDEWQPRTDTEVACVEDMTIARWRQMRLWGVAKADFDREMSRQDLQLGPPQVRAAIVFRNLTNSSRVLDNFHRYEASYERQFSRALKRLRDLQSTRPDPPEPYVPLSPSGGTWNETEISEGPNPKIEQ